MEQVSGWSEQGGTSIVIPGTQGSGTQRFQQSFRGATITVRDSSNNLATIYSDDLASPTAKANPFTASSTTGSWSFFTTTGTYTLTFSGGSITAPFSITVNVGLGNAGGIPSYAFASLPTSKTQNAGDIARVTDTTRGIWMDTGVQWFATNGQIANAKEFGLTGDGVTNDRAALNTLANTVLSSGGTIFFPNGTYIIGSNITLPANVSLVFSKLAILSPSVGVVVTILGPISAGLFQIFTGSGTVSFLANRGITEVYPHWWGVLGDNSTDDAAAFNLAITAASTNAIPLKVPVGTYLTSGNMVPKPNTNIVGAGIDQTIFNYTETSGAPCFVSSSVVGNVSFRDFTVRGQWDSNNSDGGSTVRGFTINGVQGVVSFNRVKCYAIRDMSISVASAYFAEAIDCHIERSASDGINFTDCPNAKIEHNTGKNIGDDFIAWSVSASAVSPVRSGSTIIGNIGEDTFGIKALGASSLAVTGNVLRRCKGYGIWVGGQISTEARNSTSSISITGNVVEDCINSLSVGGGNQGDCIVVGSFAQIGNFAAAVLPGRNNAGATAMTTPWGYLQNAYVDANSVMAGGWGWNVSGNSCIRTLQSAVTYSTWGYGQQFLSTGFQNPVMSEGWLETVGIKIRGCLRHAKISNNTLMAGGYGVYFAINGNPDWCIEMVHITDNFIYQALSNGIDSDLAGALKMSLVVKNNFIDCDPFMESANRAANNTWTNVLVPAGISMQYMNGVVVGGNHFRNCTRAHVGNASTIAQFVQQEVQHCDPTVVGGYNAGNKSIGYVSPLLGISAYTFVLENGDLSSTSYGQILNLLYSADSVMPAAGKWPQHFFVTNTDPSVDGNGRRVLGWLRLTTGSGHVLNTDWQQQWVSNATWA